MGSEPIVEWIIVIIFWETKGGVAGALAHFFGRCLYLRRKEKCKLTTKGNSSLT